MSFKEFLKKHGITLEPDLILNIILLIIPGFRFIGSFWMYSRIQRKYGFMGIKKFALFMLALLVATGTLAEVFTDVIWPLSIAAIAGAVAYFAFSKQRDRLGELQACLIGRDDCSVDQLCETLNLNERQLERYVTKLKKQGRLPSTTYFDRARRMLILTPAGRKETPRTNENRQNTQEEPKQAPINEKSKYDKILYQIRYINEQIDDKEMSEKIYHIENTTANIFHLVEQKPERADEIQSFLEYYLPTTMNLLYKYSQLEKQGDINSENIKIAKANIEGIMNKLVEGFDTQLDKLFKSDAIDITNDVKVLEKMMQMDKLNK